MQISDTRPIVTECECATPLVQHRRSTLKSRDRGRSQISCGWARGDARNETWPLLRCGLSGLRPQGAQKQDQLPALLFGQTAEGGHAASGIAVGDFPEQRAIALRLDDRLSQVGRMFV